MYRVARHFPSLLPGFLKRSLIGKPVKIMRSVKKDAPPKVWKHELRETQCMNVCFCGFICGFGYKSLLMCTSAVISKRSWLMW
jgi:hypothetical protein